MKKQYIIIITILTIISIVVSIVFLINKLNKKRKIDEVYEILEENNLQENENTNFKYDENIIGIVKIEKIGFEDIVYDGTDLETLDKGIGHFKNSPVMNGNVCLAGHNSNRFWAKLNTLKEGDKIIYTTLLGVKEYKVNNITKIYANDWSLLENSDKNIITLITCVKGKPNQRLCIQGIEV